jgi:hypothetical protein
MGIDPAVKFSPDTGVADHGLQSRLGILEMMEDADTISHIGAWTVILREVRLDNFTGGRFGLSYIFPCRDDRVAEVDSGQVLGVPGEGVGEEAAIAATQFQNVGIPEVIGSEWLHPINELIAGINRPLGKVVP